jgi:hypothetical protein
MDCNYDQRDSDEIWKIFHRLSSSCVWHLRSRHQMNPERDDGGDVRAVKDSVDSLDSCMNYFR